MKLNQVRMALVVAEKGRLRAAACALGISQPATSDGGGGRR